MCSCLAIFARILLGLISLLLMLVGLLLLVVGIIVKVSYSTFDPFIQIGLGFLKAQAEAADTNGVLTLPVNIDIEELVGGLAIAFIVIGAVLAALGIFGLISACCMVKCMIIVYLVLVALLTCAFLIIVIILAVKPTIITDPGKDEVLKLLQKEYAGNNGADVTSLMWNVIMPALSCCGVNDYNDFDASSKWYGLHGLGTSDNYAFPIACCKAGSITTAGCPADPDNNKNVGCFDEIVKEFLNITGVIFISFACGSVGFPGLLTFFAAVLLHKELSGANKVHPI